MTELNTDRARLLAEGEWHKDSAFQYYEQDGRIYQTVVVDRMNREILAELTEDITDRFPITELSWEDRLQWVMKYTDVEWENLYITERAADPSTPTRVMQLEGFKLYF